LNSKQAVNTPVAAVAVLQPWADPLLQDEKGMQHDDFSSHILALNSTYQDVAHNPLRACESCGDVW
jgi:hypothetical protein